MKSCIPGRNGKELTSTVNMKCAEYFNRLYMNENKLKKRKKGGRKQKNEKLEQALLSTAHNIIQDW